MDVLGSLRKEGSSTEMGVAVHLPHYYLLPSLFFWMETAHLLKRGTSQYARAKIPLKRGIQCCLGSLATKDGWFSQLQEEHITLKEVDYHRFAASIQKEIANLWKRTEQVLIMGDEVPSFLLVLVHHLSCYNAAPLPHSSSTQEDWNSHRCEVAV